MSEDSQRLITSVCTGAAILAASGCLDAGQFVTSAGVSAGIDMGFYLVARLAGVAVAEKAALSAEYGWDRNPDTPIYHPQQAIVPTSRKE